MRISKINALFTAEEVKHLQEWQASDYVHPFTCCDHIIMEVSEAGFTCPKCGRLQTWCHDFMTEPLPDRSIFLEEK